jgi:hypothetical protein
MTTKELIAAFFAAYPARRSVTPGALAYFRLHGRLMGDKPASTPA